MKFFAKRITPLLIAILLAAPASFLQSCDQTEDLAPVVDQYFTSLTQGDYGACYGMLLPIEEEMTQSSFIERHSTIFSAIRLSNLHWSMKDSEQTSLTTATLTYDVTYSTEILPDFTLELTIPLVLDQLDWKIDWTPALIFPGMDWEDTIKVVTLRPKRGEILDSQANAYAVNEYADTVYIRISSVEDLQATSTSLSLLLKMDAKEIRDMVTKTSDKNQDIAVIKAYYPNTIDSTLTQMLTDIPGVGIDRSQFTPMRYYPQLATFSHMLGYTRPITAEDGDLDPARYDADSRLGASGLELAYEEQMTGYRGFEISIHDKEGEKKATVVRQDAQDGLDLELTLDYDLQIRAETLLSRLDEGVSGVIIAMDYSNGDLLAAASFPDYDPNIFSFPMSNEEAAAIPAFNSITQGLFPPGSTVKPFIAAMSLQEGIFNANYEFTETIDLRKRQWTPTKFGDWNYPPITRVSNYSGPMNMENAIVKSDNIYFANVALTAGWDKLIAFYESIGFNQPIPFDLPVKQSSIFSDGSRMNLRLLATSGYGQGEMTTTPLHMAYAFSAFANDGDIMTPRLVKSLKRMEGMTYNTIETIEPSIWLSDTVSQNALDTLTPMLRKVITDGSGKKSSLPDIQVLGKTGTAEKDDNKQREISWAIAYVRGTDYTRLVCVMLDVPAGEGDFRHDCVREMLSP